MTSLRMVQPGVNFDQWRRTRSTELWWKVHRRRTVQVHQQGHVPSAEDKLIAHLSALSWVKIPLTHTHIIKGSATLYGDLTLTDTYSIDAGGDLTIGHNATFGASPADLFKVYGTSTFYEDVTD